MVNQSHGNGLTLLRDARRIVRLLAKIQDLWIANPDWRLGQLIALAASASGSNRFNVFHVEDGRLEEGLDELDRVGTLGVKLTPEVLRYAEESIRPTEFRGPKYGPMRHPADPP